MRLPGLVLGIGVLLLSAQPAAAFSSVTSTGVVGSWKIEDNPVVDQEGARCFFVNGTGGSVLDHVRVRPPIAIQGTHANMTWVGWRFKILRSTDGGATYQTFFTSSVWQAKASLSNAAAGFAFKSWNAPSNIAESKIRVQVTILWYRPGSRSKVDGKIVGQYDNYIEKFAGMPAAGGTTPFCYTLEA